MTIGIEQLAQVFYLCAELLTFVGVSDEHTVGGELDELGSGLDIEAPFDSVARVHKWFMLNELETTAVVNQRVACDACLLMVSLGESAIDHHQFAVSLDRILTLGGMDWHMAVDDMTVRSCDAEGIEYAVADDLVVAELEVVAFLFFIGGLVDEEIALKGCHLRLVEQG